MARIYTARHIAADNVITPDDLNKSSSQAAAVLNGNLDSNNLPMDIGGVRFVDRVGSTPIATVNYSAGVFSDFYSTLDSGATYLDAIFTVDLRDPNIDLQPEWNPLTDDIDIASLALPNLKEGILEGCCIVDWERRVGYDGGTAGGGSQKTIFGIFLDDQLISETPYMYPRRDTQSIPFSVYVNANAHTLAVKYKASYDSTLTAGNSQYDGTFEIFTIAWAFENRFR